MSDAAVRVEGLGKRYRLGALQGAYRYGSLRESLVGAAQKPWRHLWKVAAQQEESQELWALRDVSFEVKHGEVLGIIGRNGAGKSTLLKILSRITEPTTGRAEVRGRVGSLLEVGTGFHPELTGRENIFLNGTILGMRSAEIRRRFDEIVAFAEIENFIDTPVKRYSSGMYVRLAFAVAAHLEPEILLIDEVLAVGDVAFQKKCLGKIDEVAHEGRTVLFVSHAMAAVESLCRRGVVLHHGRITYAGTQHHAISHYLSSLETTSTSLAVRKDRSGSGAIRITSIEFRDMAGNSLDTAMTGKDLDICLYYEAINNLPARNVIASIAVKTQMDVPVFLQHNRLTGNLWDTIPRRGTFVCRLRRLPLPPSVYRITFSILRHGEYLDRINDAVALPVVDGDFFGTGEVPPIAHGLCLVDAEWRLEHADVKCAKI